MRRGHAPWAGPQGGTSWPGLFPSSSGRAAPRIPLVAQRARRRPNSGELPSCDPAPLGRARRTLRTGRAAAFPCPACGLSGWARGSAPDDGGSRWSGFIPAPPPGAAPARGRWKQPPRGVAVSPTRSHLTLEAPPLEYFALFHFTDS